MTRKTSLGACVVASFVTLLTCLPTQAGAQQSTEAPPSRVSFNWIDSTRRDPWTVDTTIRREMLVHVYFREEARDSSPLVVFSTARNVAPKAYETLVSHLVRSGYVVAIVDHLGERSGQQRPNGTTVPNVLDRVAPDRNRPSFRVQDSVFSRRWVELRAADLSAARAFLQKLAAVRGNALSGRLDEKSAAAGHGLGGLSAAKACERDAAFNACANLDGLSYSLPMHVDTDTMIARQPFLFINKPTARASDEELTREDDEIVARMNRRLDLLMGSARGGSIKFNVPNADHMDFAGGGDGTSARITRATLTAFLDTWVRGVRASLVDLAPPGAGVSMTRYLPRWP
jgi:hypothetical protein